MVRDHAGHIPLQRQLRYRQGKNAADFDACWDTDGVDLDTLKPVLLDLSRRRTAQKARFGGHLFPNVAEAQSGLVFSSSSRTNVTPAARASSC